MRALVCIALIAVLALAGCSSSPKTSSGPATSSKASGTPTTSVPATTSAASNGTNHAPKASLTVSATGLNATFSVGGSDEDKDKLTGSLDFGDGTAKATINALPGTVTHPYAKPGNFTAVLTVSDGKTTAKAEIVAKIVAVAGTGGAPVIFSGHIDAPDAIAATEGECAGAIAASGSGLGDEYDVTAKLTGATFKLEPSADMVVKWIDADASYVGDDSTSGKVPKGAVHVDICGIGPGAVQVDYTLTIQP